jgi:hypothetical protein
MSVSPTSQTTFTANGSPGVATVTIAAIDPDDRSIATQAQVLIEQPVQGVVISPGTSWLMPSPPGNESRNDVTLTVSGTDSALVMELTTNDAGTLQANADIEGNPVSWSYVPPPLASPGATATITPLMEPVPDPPVMATVTLANGETVRIAGSQSVERGGTTQLTATTSDTDAELFWCVAPGGGTVDFQGAAATYHAPDTPGSFMIVAFYRNADAPGYGMGFWFITVQ